MKVLGFLLHKSFKKDFKKLPKQARSEFKRKRDFLVVNSAHPALHLHSLHGEWAGKWSINVTGNIRAIFKLQGNIAIFVNIGTHSELYE